MLPLLITPFALRRPPPCCHFAAIIISISLLLINIIGWLLSSFTHYFNISCFIIEHAIYDEPCRHYYVIIDIFAIDYAGLGYFHYAAMPCISLFTPHCHLRIDTPDIRITPFRRAILLLYYYDADITPPLLRQLITIFITPFAMLPLSMVFAFWWCRQLPFWCRCTLFNRDAISFVISLNNTLLTFRISLINISIIFI